MGPLKRPQSLERQAHLTSSIWDFQTPSSQQMHRAILFGHASSKPTFVWISYHIDQAGQEILEGLEEMVPGDTVTSFGAQFDFHSVRNTKVESTIGMFFVLHGGGLSLPINKSSRPFAKGRRRGWVRTRSRGSFLISVHCCLSGYCSVLPLKQTRTKIRIQH